MLCCSSNGGRLGDPCAADLPFVVQRTQMLGQHDLLDRCVGGQVDMEDRATTGDRMHRASGEGRCLQSAAVGADVGAQVSSGEVQSARIQVRPSGCGGGGHNDGGGRGETYLTGEVGDVECRVFVDVVVRRNHLLRLSTTDCRWVVS